MPRSLTNPPAVTVSATAVIVLTANPKRKYACIQQTSANPVRIGAAGVTAATGIRLAQYEKLILEGDEVPTEALYAIREGATDGTCVSIEVGE